MNVLLLQSATANMNVVGLCLLFAVIVGFVWGFTNRGEDKWTADLKEARKKAYKEREELNAQMKAKL